MGFCGSALRFASIIYQFIINMCEGAHSLSGWLETNIVFATISEPFLGEGVFRLSHLLQLRRLQG